VVQNLSFGFGNTSLRFMIYAFGRRVTSGRGQPLSLTLSFGEIPWFEYGAMIGREMLFFVCTQ
jgi:hypothetical protein